MKADEGTHDVESDDAVVIHLPVRNHSPEPDLGLDKPTRYARKTGGLPRLTDDPEWRPDSNRLPEPVNEGSGLWSRLREALGR